MRLSNAPVYPQQDSTPPQSAPVRQPGTARRRSYAWHPATAPSHTTAERDRDALCLRRPCEPNRRERHTTCEMPSPLIPSVRSPPQHHSKDCCEEIRHRRIPRNQARVSAITTPQSAKNQRHPQIDDINPNLNDDVHP